VPWYTSIFITAGLKNTKQFNSSKLHCLDRMTASDIFLPLMAVGIVIAEESS